MISTSGLDVHDVLPAVYAVFGRVKRWLMGTQHGEVRPADAQAHLDEWTFRLNRRQSRNRGLLFYRLMCLAVAGDVVRYQDLCKAGLSARPRPHRALSGVGLPASKPVQQACRGDVDRRARKVTALERNPVKDEYPAMGHQKNQSDPTPCRSPLAEWDFTKGAHLADLLDSKRTLQYSDHGRVSWHVDEDVGGCMLFAGDGGHLRLPPEDVGNLDMGAAGEVTVLALVQRSSLGHDFIAGLWQESDYDPRRQYALFVNLPVYGGGDQVVGHVSRSGGASPNLPYSRDYAASARMVRPGEWRIIAFRYDGKHATAFLDGIADPRPYFEEVGPPLGEGLRYAKNPYYFDEGMYIGSLAEFTVGAVRLSSGIGNAFSGGIARLAVWNRALTATEVAARTAEWAPPTMPIAAFDWWRKDPAPGRAAGGEDGHEWSLESVGVKQTEGLSTPVRALPSRLVRPTADDDAIVEIPLPAAAQRVTVEDISNPAHIHLAVRDVHGRVDLEQASEPGTWLLPSRPSASILELHFRAGRRLSIGAICFLK